MSLGVAFPDEQEHPAEDTRDTPNFIQHIHNMDFIVGNDSLQSATMGKNIYVYDKNGKGALAYMVFVEGYLELLK